MSFEEYFYYLDYEEFHDEHVVLEEGKNKIKIYLKTLLFY
jgi:hypothetical protein